MAVHRSSVRQTLALAAAAGVGAAVMWARPEIAEVKQRISEATNARLAEATSRVATARAALHGRPIVSRVPLLGSVDFDGPVIGLLWDRVTIRPRPLLNIPSGSERVTVSNSQFNGGTGVQS